MSDQPIIIAEITPDPVVVANVTPQPEIIAEVGALYAPPSPRYGVAPAELTAYAPIAGVIAVDVPAINGTTFIVPDFAAASDFVFGAFIPADGAGAFSLIVMPQSGAGTNSTGAYFLTVGTTDLPLVTTGNSLPFDLTHGAVLDFTSDGVNDWQVSVSKYTPNSTDFEFVTAVSDLRSHMYVGVAHDGGGVTDYIDQTRVGDDAGYYMAADNAEPILPSGTAFPTGGAAMIALRNQASAAGEGVTGFYHARRMPVSLTFTISTPLGDITVTPANYASPQPVAGDVCLVNGLTVDGQWQNSNIQEGEDLAVGDTMTWRTVTPGGMFTDFEDITPGTAVGNVVGPASAVNNGVALFDGTTGKLIKDGGVLGDAAAKNTGTTAGTVAAGDDSRITGATPTSRTLAGLDLSANRSVSDLTTALGGTSSTTLAIGNHTHTGPVVGGQDEGSTISNTTTPTSLLDSTITVAGTAGQMIQVQGCVSYVNNSGTTRQPTMALKLGSTTVVTLTHQTIQASATTRALMFNFVIRVEGNNDLNASGQTVSFNASAVGVMSSGRGTATEAIQSGVALDLIWTHATADATQTAALDYVVVTRMGGAGSIS